jgi:hypothetical protein
LAQVGADVSFYNDCWQNNLLKQSIYIFWPDITYKLSQLDGKLGDCEGKRCMKYINIEDRKTMQQAKNFVL